jgi:sialate O-acetylesterase
MARWKKTEAEWDEAKARADYEQALAAWRKRAAEAEAAGKPEPPGRPWGFQNAMTGNARPGNLYHARLGPVMPYTIRGVIWYQGETNAGRAYQYREMFPLMISTWREAWGQGEFPFYWVQLADFMAERAEPAESGWAELREAQTMTQDRLPNTGQAVIIDLGEGADIHPRNKLEVARRLARWALARDYGRDIVCQSPRYESLETSGNTITVKFEDVDGGLRTVDTQEVRGFAIAGEDKKWVWAEAEIVAPDAVAVSSKEVEKPVAVRYAWADNPVCNLYNQVGLPVTPFRTDDWPGVTINAR